MGSIDDTVPHPKKFNTSLADFSAVHEDKTGPYAESLSVDVLIVGAGFGTASPSPPLLSNNTSPLEHSTLTRTITLI
jgi:hypothetical protein